MDTLKKVLKRLTPDTRVIAVRGTAPLEDSYCRAYVRNGGGSWWRVTPTGACRWAQAPSEPELLLAHGRLEILQTLQHMPSDGLDLFAARVAELLADRGAAR